MGWCANADWHLILNDEKDADKVMDLLAEFHEDSDFDARTVDIVGWGYGKAYIEESRYDELAKLATGTADWHSDEDGSYHWRIRFKDGAWVEHGGEIVYPTDKESA